MRQLPCTPVPAAARDPLNREARSVVERVACWSVRHRKTAVAGWLAFVLAAFIGGQLLSAPAVHQYDPGQSGQAERMLHGLKVVSAPAESVLVTAREQAGQVREQAL